MSKTLQELQEKNKSLKNEAQFRRELVEIGEERNKSDEENKKLEKKLIEQNQRLSRGLNVSPTIIALRKTLDPIINFFFKLGKAIYKGLMRYGKFLNEQERKNQRRIKQLNKPRKKKTIERRKTTSRKIRRRR